MSGNNSFTHSKSAKDGTMGERVPWRCLPFAARPDRRTPTGRESTGVNARPGARRRTPLPGFRGDRRDTTSTDGTLSTTEHGDLDHRSAIPRVTIDSGAERDSTSTRQSSTRILSVEGSANVSTFKSADEWRAQLAYDALDTSAAVKLTSYRYEGKCATVILDHHEGKTTGYLASKEPESVLYRLPEDLDTKTFVIDGSVETVMLNHKPARLRVPQLGGDLDYAWIDGQTVRVNINITDSENDSPSPSIPHSTEAAE